MDRDRYLERIGIDPSAVPPRDDEAGYGDEEAGYKDDAPDYEDDVPGYETLRRLQRGHVTTVPFETLSITGDPFDDSDPGEGVTLELPALYEKIVERRRGGFCFELNGLFGWLLRDLGFDADRIAARVVGDRDSRPPANHHTHLVRLNRTAGPDRSYVVDVGLGSVAIRRPLPLDGTVVTDEAGVDWRVVESGRPNADYSVEYRPPGEDWDERYFFRTTPRTLAHFEATCEYLATDPESTFTGDPVVTMTTDDGYAKLSPEKLVYWAPGETYERAISAEEWHDVLETDFGLAYGRE